MRRLTRRHLLGAVGIGAIAGCLEEPTSGSLRGGNGSGDGNGNENGGRNETDYPHSAPGDGDLPSSCPEYGDDVDRVVCYDGVDPDEEPTYLEPSARSVEEGGSIEFTLHNGSDDRLATNFYNWRVDKHVDGEWYRVAPRGYNQPLMYIEPDDSHTWTVRPDNAGIEAGDRVGSLGGTEEITLKGVGTGTYAFRGRGWLEDERSEEILAFATTFELEGEPLPLTPTNAIDDTEWEGETLVAQSSRGEPDDEHYRLGAYELETVEEPSGEPRSMITEQLLRNSRLRDAIALAHEHDASTVRLEEYDATHPIFGHDSDAVYEYQGSYYVVRTRELKD